MEKLNNERRGHVPDDSTDDDCSMWHIIPWGVVIGMFFLALIYALLSHIDPETVSKLPIIQKLIEGVNSIKDYRR